MKLLIIVLSLLVATYEAPTDEICNGVTYRGQYYDKVYLQGGIDRPFLLAVDHETDILYYNYEVEGEYKSAGLNLITNEIKDIEGVPNGFSHTIDYDNRLLYIGTTDGIYVHNLNTNQSEFFGAKGKFVWSIFYKDDVLYYSVHPDQDFYTLSNGTVEKYKDLKHTKVHYFVLDYDNDIFFSNDTGLYKHVKGTDDILYKNFGEWDIRAITLDLYGNIYAGVHDGVYRVRRHEELIENVLPVYDLFGLAFDKDNNVIYSDTYSVYQLKLSKYQNCLTVNSTEDWGTI